MFDGKRKIMKRTTTIARQHQRDNRPTANKPVAFIEPMTTALVEIGGGTKTKSSITYQNFFTLYPKLAGMTGTAKTAEKEFQDIYKLEVSVVTIKGY